MQTVPEFACYVEEEDFILHNGQTLIVSEIDDTDDLITFALRDEDGEPVRPLTLGPFEPVERITSLEDDEDITIEDI